MSVWTYGVSGYGDRKYLVCWRRLPALALIAVGTVAILAGTIAGIEVAKSNAEADRQHRASVSSVVHETYGVSLTDQQAKDLEWPAERWGLNDWPSTGQRYGTTEIVEQDTARTLRLVWDGTGFVLRVLSERSLLPGKPLAFEQTGG